MRVGLVLGAGGLVGASWLIGALQALEDETGWAPAEADVVVGTSAGSVVGALLAAGVPPAYMGAYSSGATLEEIEAQLGALEGLPGAEQLAAIDRDETDRFRLQRALPPIGPGSWRMALGTLRRPLSHAPGAVVGGWLPRGFVSTASISGLVDRFVAGPWPEHPDFRAVTCDYRTGRRVAFGAASAPPADVRDAVAASCAIPGFYHPVTIGDRRYVDGGLCSMSNLDLLCGDDLDLVVALNPTSSRASGPRRSPGDVLGAAMRASSGRRLGHEAKKLRAVGTEVLLLQPSSEDLAVMGPNLMARGRRAEVIEQAVRSTALALRATRRDRPALPTERRRRPRSERPARLAAAA